MQRSVPSNFFVGHGGGGAGQGEGAYGVADPTASAEDQVRYLSEILASSAAARAASQAAGAAKQAFADKWNAEIAPRYGVPEVSREKI
ncbi:MAG: hypothetical protein LBG11_07035 [Bifidobacteriaceae bacterium]|nr:hypothetical protein [Bifidobacteriaceae bacterium]